MLVTRKILHGAVIVVEYPIVFIPVMSFLPPDIREEIFRMVFDRVEEPERTELYDLVNCKPPEMCGREEGIARTNGVGIKLHVPPGSPEASKLASGVFLKISQCNHSCSPNANYDWDLRPFTLSLYATRVAKKSRYRIYHPSRSAELILNGKV
ncbi:hypothetical protein PLICRDRAFT_693973 [Plicaturopsis crispa FD-325 SS-3]|nr:hypothetical protein PLICRDRAFT_693973 [Plicaturopsis crispa FD-325 SS-3]